MVSRAEFGLPQVPTLTGLGLTWVQALTQAGSGSSGSIMRTTVFYAWSSGATPGALTIAHASTTGGDDTQWIVSEWSGTLGAADNGASGVRQASGGTSNAMTGLTLGAFANASSASVGFFGFLSGGGAVVGSGYTVLDFITTGNWNCQAEYKSPGATLVNWGNNPGGAQRAFIALELAANTSDATVTVGVADETDETIPIHSVSGGTDDVVFLGVAEETDEAIPLLSIRTGPVVRSYPRAGTLGCGSWTVQVSRRGGTPVEVEVPATSVRMNRTEDDLSAATASFANSGVPDWCVGALADLRPWVYELSLLRDSSSVWAGPISNQLTFTRSSTTIDARDLFSWMERRVLPYSRHFDDDELSDIFAQLVDDALSADPSPNITTDVMASGILLDRTIQAADFTRAADALRDLAAIGVDFTMVGRTMRVRPRGGGDLLPNALLDAHVLAEPQATLDGIQATSQWIVTGDTNIWGAAGGVGHDTGLVTQVYSDPDIIRVPDGRAAAVELLAASGVEPLQVKCSLNPDAPFDFNDLIPGNFIDTRLDCGNYQVDEVLMLSGLDIDARGGKERVDITLIRAASVGI